MNKSAVDMNKEQRVQLFRNMKSRARLLHGEAAERVAVFCENGIQTLQSDDAQRNLRLLIESARSGNKESIDQLQALRIETTNNFLLATSVVLPFFTTVNLNADEAPYFVNETRNEVSVYYMGPDGGRKLLRVDKNQDRTQVPLSLLTTDIYEFPMIDPIKGEVKTSAMGQVDMSYDMAIKTDALLWPFIKAAIGDFTLTGAKAARTYVPHSAVNVKNLPTSNLLTPATGNTNSSNWRKACLDLIARYCTRWGVNAFTDGAIAPVAIIMPSSDLTGWLESVDLTSQPNTLVEQVFENGYVMNYGGFSWTLVGDSTLDPDAGRAYVRTNKPVGTFFTKTALDRVHVIEDERAQRVNKGEISMQKYIGAHVATPRTVNVMGVQYRTAH